MTIHPEGKNWGGLVAAKPPPTLPNLKRNNLSFRAKREINYSKILNQQI